MTIRPSKPFRPFRARRTWRWEAAAPGLGQDEANRLVYRKIYPGGGSDQVTHTYNRQSQPLTLTDQHNPANQITAIAGPGGVVQPAYDPAGNMTRMHRPGDWSEADELTWDAWNRLVRVRPAASSSSSLWNQLNTRKCGPNA